MPPWRETDRTPDARRTVKPFFIYSIGLPAFFVVSIAAARVRFLLFEALRKSMTATWQVFIGFVLLAI